MLGYDIEINLEFGGTVAICSSIFVSLGLYYLKWCITLISFKFCRAD